MYLFPPPFSPADLWIRIGLLAFLKRSTNPNQALLTQWIDRLHSGSGQINLFWEVNYYGDQLGQ